MGHPAPAKHKNSATMLYRKIKIKSGIRHILHLPGGQQIIILSWNGSCRVWDLERGTQVGNEWEDKDGRVSAIALSPDGKTVASGSNSRNETVRLRNVDTGKVKEWTGCRGRVLSVCWNSDGGRVVSGSRDETLRVWDVESGEIILGPIKVGKFMNAVCSSPDGKMIATGGLTMGLKVWDANSDELLETLTHRQCRSFALREIGIKM